MGLIIAFAMAAASFLALWRLGKCPRLALELSLAALLLGLAGYSWQGQPDMQGQPAFSGNSLR